MELTAASQYSRSMQLLLSVNVTSSRDDGDGKIGEGADQPGTFTSVAKEAKRAAVIVDKLKSALDDLKEAGSERNEKDDQISAYRKTANALRKLQRFDRSEHAEELGNPWNRGEWQSGFGRLGGAVTDFQIDKASSSTLSITSDNLNATFSTSRSVSISPEGISFSFTQTASAEFITDDGLKVSIEMSRAREAYIGSSSGFAAGSGFETAA